MIFKNTLFIAILIGISHFVSGQGDIRDGYIIDNQGDTIPGSIAYQTNAKNFITAIQIIDGNQTKYGPDDILGYGFNNYKHYVSGILSGEFVEVLVTGELNFYKGNEFYLMKKGHQVHKVRTSRAQLGASGHINRLEPTRWQRVVSHLIMDCIDDIYEKVYQASLREKTLTELIIEYNECKGADYKDYKSHIPWTKYELGLSVAAVRSNLVTEGAPGGYLSEIYESNNISAGLYLGINAPRISDRINFQVEALFIQNSFEATVIERGEVWEEIHYTSVDLSSLSLPASISYSFPEKRIGAFLEVGMIYNYNFERSSYRNTDTYVSGSLSNTFESEPFTVDHTQIGYWGGAGLAKTIGNIKTKLALRYYSLPNLNELDNFKANVNRLGLNFIIIPTRKKP